MSNYHHQCLICNSDCLKELNQYKHAYLVKCINCKFIFSQKIPSEEELIKLYKSYGRNDYHSPITIKRYNEILVKLEKYRKANRILDIGCGIGYFLEEAIKKDWEVYGTEFTDEAMNICSSKGIKMQRGILNPNNYEPGYFDVITSFEVIEHINNPVEEANNIYSLLRKKGIFYFTTPNFRSFSKNLLKENWNIISYPEHLSYYTPKTITKILKQAGFKKLSIKTTGISLTRFKKSKKKTDQPLISKESDDEKIREMAEKNIFIKYFKNIVNYILTVLCKGDTIKGFFIK